MENKNSLLKDRHLLLITGLGLLLRLYHLGVQSLWFDEAYSVYMAKSLGALWFNQISDSSPPLYYTILHFWMGLFGKDEFSLRLLSVIFGVMLVPFVYLVAVNLFDRKAGLLAAFFAAVSPIHIYYSQEVKMYTLLPLLSLASFFALLLCLKEDKKWPWVFYGLATLSVLYAHNYAVFLLLAEFIFFVLYAPKPRNAYLWFALTQGIVILLFLPRAAVILEQAALDLNPWIQPPTLADISSTFMHFSMISWRLSFTWVLSKAANLSLPFFFLVFLSGIYARQKSRLFVLSYLIIPLGSAFLLSFKIPVYIAGRYDMIVFPAFCLIMGAGLSRFKMAALRWFLICVLAVATSISLYHYYFLYSKSNDRRVAQYLQERMNKEDVLVVTELGGTVFEYYWKASWRPVFFRFPEGPRAALTREALFADPAYADSEIRELIDKIYPLLGAGNELFVVYYPIGLSDLLLSRLKNDFPHCDVVEFSPGDNLNQASRVYIFKKASAQA